MTLFGSFLYFDYLRCQEERACDVQNRKGNGTNPKTGERLTVKP